MKRALVFGIGGMDGSYLAEILLERGYEVWGTTRRSSLDNLKRIEHIKSRITGMCRVEVTDTGSIYRALNECKPDEIYYEADQDNVPFSYFTPEYTVDVTVGGVARLLEGVSTLCKDAKVFIPTSATMFPSNGYPQYELTQHNPMSPYACAKSCVYHLARYYRSVHNMFVSTGILFNHDSSRRSHSYLLHSIFYQASAIANKKKDVLNLGCLDLKVDIGYAREYMEGVWRLMQLSLPTDMVFATGKPFKIEMIARFYLSRFGISYKDKIKLVPNNDYFGTPVELIGDTTKAQREINWNPKYDAMNMFDILMNGE